MKYKKLYQDDQSYSFSDLVANICASYLQRRSAELMRRRGCKMVAFCNDCIGNAINASGFYEWRELKAIFGFLSPIVKYFGAVSALDIGANIGNHSVFFSGYFKWVHAFEPHPLTAAVLDINASQHKNIVVHRVALSDFGGTLIIQENPTNMGGTRVVAENKFMGGIRIQSRCLDDMIKDLGEIGLIKLDVEGFEGKIIEGGVGAIKEFWPIVLFETHLSDFSDTMNEVDLLAGMGYRFAWVDPVGRGLQKYLNVLMSLVARKRIKSVCTGSSIVPADHSMVIAVPSKWQKQLGMM